MSKSSILKIKFSLTTSLLSATGLVGLLWLFPSKSDVSNLKLQTSKNSTAKSLTSNSKNFTLNSASNLEPNSSYIAEFNVIEKTKLQDSDVWSLRIEGVGNIFYINSFYVQADILSEIQTKKVNILGSFNRDVRTLSQLGLYNHFGLVQNYTWYQPQLRKLEINYKINSNLTASVKTSYLDANFFDDRIRTMPTTTAGLGLRSSKYITTEFITGATFSNFPTYLNQNGLSFLNTRLTEREMDSRSILELQTNIKPTKNFGIQAALYDTNRGALNELTPQRGARVGLSWGFEQFALNLRYNYSGNEFLRGANFSDPSSRDYAGIGLTLFLDKFKNYSLFLGNNYHNLFTNTRYDNKENHPTASNSFFASFRGLGPANTSFFLNFRNQVSRDIQYSNFGMFRFPVQNLYIFEFATALGLEISF